MKAKIKTGQKVLNFHSESFKSDFSFLSVCLDLSSKYFWYLKWPPTSLALIPLSVNLKSKVSTCTKYL